MGSPAYAGMDPRWAARSQPPRWLPRLRGDGPQTGKAGRADQEAPPPTRGWTRGDMGADGQHRGSPAYAGMDLGRRRSTLATNRLPRLRGDGPRWRCSPDGVHRAPPPTRGWTGTSPRRSVSRKGSPAYAGMDPRRLTRETRRRWLPRLRGDGPEVPPGNSGDPPAPPPTRGWTALHRRPAPPNGGSPAYAGMDLSSATRFRRIAGLPRLRGDGPTGEAWADPRLKAPPPTRGWTRPHPFAAHAADGSPAYAGMDLVLDGCGQMSEGLPRLRGDGPEIRMLRWDEVAAPPPTRGWTHVAQLPRLDRAGSPAYAGMDPERSRNSTSTPGLPRLRGDGPTGYDSNFSHSSAPPPTRGWTRRPVRLAAGEAGSPAYAGMDRRRWRPCWRS